MPQIALMAELKTICRRACQPRAALPRDEAHHRAGLASTMDPVSRFVCCPLASEVAGWLLLTEQPQPQHATRTVPRGEYRRPAATHKMQWAIGMSTASQHNITLTGRTMAAFYATTSCHAPWHKLTDLPKWQGYKTVPKHSLSRYFEAISSTHWRSYARTAMSRPARPGLES